MLERALAGERLTADDGYRLIHADATDLSSMMAAASELRDRGHGRTVTYSRKVFIPLTNLCRQKCGYCTFARGPRDPIAHTMSPDEVLAVARAGARQGCKEALFSLGERPEEIYDFVRDDLARFGHETTSSYLREMAELVLRETGLQPHINQGLMERDEIVVAARSQRLDGHDARDGVDAAAREGRRALELPRQDPGGAPAHDAHRRRGEGRLDDGHPHRHRRDARGARRFAARDPRPARASTATSRK